MKYFFTFLAGFLICCILEVALYNVVAPGAKDITALKPITYSTGVDALIGTYRKLEINAIDKNFNNCTIVYQISHLDGGSQKVSITNELGELYTGEELSTLRIQTNKSFYIAFKTFEDNILSRIHGSLLLLINLVEWELEYGETLNYSVNATNLLTAYTEDGTKLTNYSITFDIQERGQIENAV